MVPEEGGNTADRKFRYLRSRKRTFSFAAVLARRTVHQENSTQVGSCLVLLSHVGNISDFRVSQFAKIYVFRYVDIVAGMTVTEDGEIVIVDSVQPSLYKLDEQGTLSTWFDCKGVMTEPSDIAVRGKISSVSYF